MSVADAVSAKLGVRLDPAAVTELLVLDPEVADWVLAGRPEQGGARPETTIERAERVLREAKQLLSEVVR